MLRRPVKARTRTLLLAAFALAILLPGCAERGPVTDAGTEGLYLAAGPLTYQVQVSRELNPTDVEDNAYLSNLGPGVTPPGPGEEWFGVWLQVKNESAMTARSTSNIRIVDTQGTMYVPIPMPASNPFAYEAATLAPGAFQPAANSAAASGPTQGSLVLFKIKTSAYQDRPLTLELLSAEAPEKVQASVKLDL